MKTDKKIEEIFIRAGLTPSEDETAGQMVSELTNLLNTEVQKAREDDLNYLLERFEYLQNLDSISGVSSDDYHTGLTVARLEIGEYLQSLDKGER